MYSVKLVFPLARYLYLMHPRILKPSGLTSALFTT